MEYRDFVEQVKNQIQDFLPVKFADATVEVNQVVKNNDCVLDGLLIKRSNLIPAYQVMWKMHSHLNVCVCAKLHTCL